MDTRWLRNSFVYLVIMVAVLAIFFTLVNPSPREDKIPITELMTVVQRDAGNGRVDTIVVDGNTLIADTSDGKKTAIKPERSDIMEMLQARGIKDEQVNVEDTSARPARPVARFDRLLPPGHHLRCAVTVHDASSPGQQ